MEEVVEGLTFEELIGTLIDAGDEIKAFVAERKLRDEMELRALNEFDRHLEEERHGKNI
jgi:hypothetical protein